MLVLYGPGFHGPNRRPAPSVSACRFFLESLGVFLWLSQSFDFFSSAKIKDTEQGSVLANGVPFGKQRRFLGNQKSGHTVTRNGGTIERPPPRSRRFVS